MNKACPRLLAISSGALTSSSPMECERLASWLADLPNHSDLGVQIREKRLVDLELLQVCQEARAIFAGHISVNGRPDIALAADLDGVHLPSTGLDTAGVVRRFGQELLVGVSTHSLAEIQLATQAGADYTAFGPVFDTPKKSAPGHGPQGVEILQEAARVSPRVLAIGGIGPAEVHDVMAAGAYGVASIRATSTRVGVEQLLAEVVSSPALASAEEALGR